MKFYDLTKIFMLKEVKKCKKNYKKCRKICNYDDIRNMLISPTTNLSAYLKFDACQLEKYFKSSKKV